MLQVSINKDMYVELYRQFNVEVCEIDNDKAKGLHMTIEEIIVGCLRTLTLGL